MRLPISLFLPALWATSYVVGKGPSGLEPLPVTCKSRCPPGVSCPANDGCFIQGRANMSAEAGDRCSSTVESVIAAEQTSCAASISAEETNCISAQQSSCATSISAQQTSCSASISSAISSVSSALTECQAAAASAAVGQTCIVRGWGSLYYQNIGTVDLAGCKARCLADSKCLSYSYRLEGLGNCFLYGKAANDLPTLNYAGWVTIDRLCLD
ncbi:hypothetical protein BKA60DRAFT_656760 [Fusarium oxysporum]|nr:hypothetical protein BKA60DRAFT_656760 [Fusarium oxysporum]